MSGRIFEMRSKLKEGLIREGEVHFNTFSLPYLHLVSSLKQFQLLYQL